ncbi:hypothetical protein [Nocardia brasiliensis]|uniref:hypothetical protein n=1 Tax=Nocardia brasiliensis TaxID=37326 RepID=UPI002456730D|nr:hypothetical protein [Nocardia brasiliensis]
MIEMFGWRKSLLSSVGALGISVAAVTVAAPSTSADIWQATVSPGMSVGLGGTQYGTSCTYTVTVEGSRWTNVWFDDNVSASFAPISINLGSSGRATTSWTPHAPGWHRIDVWSPDSDRGIWVNVGIGINLGSACVVR